MSLPRPFYMTEEEILKSIHFHGLPLPFALLKLSCITIKMLKQSVSYTSYILNGNLCASLVNLAKLCGNTCLLLVQENHFL